MTPAYPPNVRLANVVFSGTTEAETASLATVGDDVAPRAAAQAADPGRLDHRARAVPGRADQESLALARADQGRASGGADAPGPLFPRAVQGAEGRASLRVTLDRDPVALL